MPIAAAFSVYLDLLRVGAAMAVLLSHWLPMLVPGISIQTYGHDAVIVFFVLSGFVMAMVCDTRERSLSDYALSRLARLWSVAVPALVLALVVYAACQGRAPEVFAATVTFDVGPLHASLMNLIFCGQGWFGAISPPLNNPFWSLNYEAWYYAAYGAFVFLRGRMRWVATVALAGLAGPAVLALAPCWVLGVLLYRWRHRLTLPAGIAAALFVATIVFYAIALDIALVPRAQAWLKATSGGLSWRLGPSQTLLGDLPLAVLVGLHFVAAMNLRGLGTFVLPVRRAITGAASYTLSIYLYHVPLMVLAWNWFDLPGHDGPLPALGAVAGATVAIIGLGRVTEHWRGPLRASLARVAPRVRAAFGPGIG